MVKKQSSSIKLARVIILLLFLSCLLLLLIINPPAQESNIWKRHIPKCKALSDNLEIYVPSNWKVSEDMQIYDGSYSKNPSAQEEKDFNNLVSQCQILIGFKNKPVSYQVLDPNNYGVITIKVDKVNVPINMQELELNIRNIINTYYDSKSYIIQSKTINNNQFVVYKSTDDRHLNYEAIKNGGAIHVSLQITDPSKDLKITKNMKQDFNKLLQKLIIK